MIYLLSSFFVIISLLLFRKFKINKHTDHQRMRSKNRLNDIKEKSEKTNIGNTLGK